MKRDPAIQCLGITKSYGDVDSKVEILKGIDLEIDQGHLTLLMGPSGSGKTTLISIIANILTPDSGTLLLLGQDLRRMSEPERAKFCQCSLGIVFQSLFLIPTLNIAENVSLPLIIAGVNKEEAHKKAVAILHRMHLGRRLHALPSQLSKGQQQRVAIARAIVNDSKIIICDEPTSALDHHTGLEIMALLEDLAKNHDKAVLVVTHDRRTLPFSDRIIYIEDGQISEEKENEENE